MLADLPKPKRFDKISSDVDNHRRLVRMQEYVTLASHDRALVQAVFASQFLNKVPSQLWETRKSRKSHLVAKNSPDVYSWESFKAWCISSFSLHDHERHVLTQLMSLRQAQLLSAVKFLCNNCICSQKKSSLHQIVLTQDYHCS